MAKFGIRTTFTLEDFNSVNTRAQELLKKVGENSKIKLDFSDGMSLDKMKQQLDKLQQEIIKASQQSSQTFSKSFDNVNKRFEQQIDQIKNNLKNIGSNVNVDTIKDDYGKIVGALAQYEDKTGNVIRKNYEIGKSLKEINEKGKYIEKLKLKLVDDSDLKNQNKMLSFLEEEKKKIEQLTNTTAKVKLHSDGDKNISKATITYTDNMSRAVTETYKLKTATQDLENVIKKTVSFEKTGTTYTDNIAKSLKTIEQYEKAINKLSTKNLELGGGKQTEQFSADLKNINSLINDVKSSGQSMTQTTKKSIDTLINAMNLENKTIKQTNDEMKKKQKIIKNVPVDINTYENKIVALKNRYKELVKEADLSKLRKEMSKLANSTDAEEYARQLKVIKNEYGKLENTVKGRGISTGQKDKMGIFSAMNQAMTKFPIWIGATTAWMEAIHKIKDGIGFIADLDKAQTNIAMITGRNREQVAGLTKEYSKLAGEIHSTTKATMDSAQGFLRAGVKEDQMQGMIRASTIGSHISGQTTEDVSQQLITISNGFRMAEKAKQSGEDYDKVMMHVVDTLSTLDDNSASSFANIATALSRTSSSAQEVGVSFEQISEYITIVSHVTNKSAESIGESWKSIFARFRDIKLGKKADEMGEEISDVEKTFKQHAQINIRKDINTFKNFGDVIDELTKKWKTLNQVDKSAIKKALAGTRQAENFGVFMDNTDKLQGYDKEVKQGDGSAEKKEETYADSIQAKIDSFKYAWEQFYQTLLSSDALKKVVNDVTYLVKWLDDLTKSSWGVKGSFLVLLPLTIRLAKGFKLVTTAIAGGQEMKLGQMMMTSLFGTMTDGTVKVISLSGALGKLKKIWTSMFTLSNPYGLIILGIAAALGVGVHAFNKYQEKQKKQREENDKLKKSQKELNEAMSKGNVKGIKESSKSLDEQQKKLNELFKKKKELENDHNKGRGITTEVDLHNTKKEIKETIEQLKGLGYTVDETTGKIFQLDSSKNVSKAFETIEKINKERQERVKNIDTIVSEINEYNKLSASENLNAQEKERLKQLTQDLKGKIKGLKIQTDEHGNAVILNTDLLDKNKQMLTKERTAILNNKDAGYAEAKTRINNEITKTQTVIAETTKRMIALQKEEDALKGRGAVIDSMKTPGGFPGMNLIPNIAGFFNSRKQQKVSNELNDSRKQLEQLQKDLQSLKSAGNENDKLINAKPEKSDKSTPDFTPTDPEKTKKSTKATKENTGETDKNREAVNKAKEAVKQYELALKSLEIQMTKNNIALGRLYEHSDKYIAKLKEKQGLIKQELALNKQQIATNGELANSLGSAGGSYAGGGSIAQQAVANAMRYRGTRYVWGGKDPSGFDCSGLVQYAYKQAGVNINGDTWSQMKQGTPISKANLQAGDAVFFNGGGHVGLYMGNGQYIHAPNKREVVKVSDLNARRDFYTARRYVSGGSSSVSRTTSSNYSGRYSGYINEAANKYGVPASLIAAIAKAESDFQNLPANSSGATGIMQLVPSTARELGVRDIHDPRQNIMGGTKEISKLLKKYNGNLDLALAGYNAGIGKVAQAGGVPSYTKGYISKVKKYMKGYGGSESSIHSTIDEQMDLIGKNMDIEKKNLELQEELNKINIQILEARLGQFDDKVKSIDRTITQLRTDVDLQNKNDINYVNYLSKIDDYTVKKLDTLKKERDFIKKEISSGIYDEKTIKMLGEKYSDIGTEMLNVTKTIKDVSLELVTAKWEAIQQIYKENIDMISNELDRLSLHEEKNIKQIMILKKQLVEQDEANIKRMTELIRETNDIAYKYHKHFLLDKVKEYTTELDKANTELEKHKKELEEVKKKIAEIKSTIEDKLREILTKTAELAKEQLDKVLKHFEETIDAELKKLDDAEKRNSYNEQKTEQLKTIADLQEKIAKLSTDDSEEGIARRLEYEKQLQEEMKKKTDLQMKHNNELKKEALTKQKEEKKKEIEKKKRDIDTRLDNVYLNLDARKALTDGYIEWIDGKRIGLQNALLQFEDLFGKGLTSLGDKIKKELLEQLKAAQDLVNNIEKNDPDKILDEHKTKNVYGSGAGIDLANARKILGSLGYNYVDTSLIDKSKLHFGEGDIIVGDTGAINGVDREDLNGATRLGGITRYDTAAIIQLYSDIQSGRIKPIDGVVYGSGSDLKNAMAWLSPLGYKFVDTSKINPRDVKFNPNDIIVGGKGAKGGVDFDVDGVTRLSGLTKNNTYDKIRQYALDEMMKLAKQHYVPRANGGVVYGTGYDLKNAKKYLTKLGYKFVDTKSVENAQLSAKDIVVGGQMGGKEQIYNSQARWLFGRTKDDTEKEIANFANTMSDIQGYFDKGGVADFTGKAMLHGNPNAVETIFNAEQGKKLYNFVNALPSNNFGYGINKTLQPAMATNNNNNITLNFKVEKMYGTENEAKGFATTIINTLKNRGKM